MVSLSRDTNSLAGGGTFFENPESSQPDIQSLLQPIVGHDKLKIFKPLNTIVPASFFLILTITMEVIVLILAFSWHDTEKICEPSSIILYAQIVYWSISLILDFYFKRKHHESRLEGYLEFYQQTHQLSRIPFYITSVWNTLFLLISTLFHDQHLELEHRCQSNKFLTPVYYMCFFITLENTVMIPILIYYICKVRKFNRNKQCPDVLQDEWMASFIQDSYSGGEVGYREQDNHIEDLLEKQADMLRYLKEQNSRLMQKVMILNNLLKTQTESLQC